MQQELFNHINVPKDKINIPSGMEKTEAYDAYCKAYDKKIVDAGGIDLQLLGIGTDGHIGFNEPGTDLNSPTHLADLDEQTIIDNARWFSSPEEVPRLSITMGVKTIMDSKELVLLAFGKKKADAIKQALTGQISSECTASALQEHKNVTFFLDEDAAS